MHSFSVKVNSRTGLPGRCWHSRTRFVAGIRLTNYLMKGIFRKVECAPANIAHVKEADGPGLGQPDYGHGVCSEVELFEDNASSMLGL